MDYEICNFVPNFSWKADMPLLLALTTSQALQKIQIAWLIWMNESGGKKEEKCEINFQHSNKSTCTRGLIPID